MSVLGFGTVYFGVGLQRVLRDGKLSDYNAEILLEKLIDRLLDRDVPRTEPAATPRAPRSRPPSRAVHQAPKPPRAPEPSPKSGLAPDPSGRAELTADAPERYARDSKSLHEARQRSRRAQDSRARIDAILRQVGVSSGDEP